MNSKQRRQHRRKWKYTAMVGPAGSYNTIFEMFREVENWCNSMIGSSRYVATYDLRSPDRSLIGLKVAFTTHEDLSMFILRWGNELVQ